VRQQALLGHPAQPGTPSIPRRTEHSTPFDRAGSAGAWKLGPAFADGCPRMRKSMVSMSRTAIGECQKHRPGLSWRVAATLLCSGLGFVVGQAQTHAAQTPPPEVTELLWGLSLLGGIVAAGIVWIAVLRRNSRRQLDTLRQRESALDQHYRDLFENAHDILFTHDLDGRLLSLNRAGEVLLGYTRAEATQLKLTQLILPEDRTAYLKVLEQLEAGAERDHVEVTLRAKEGRHVALRLNVRRQSLSGRPTQVHGVAWDITERRQAEEALRESEQRLRRALEDRIRLGRDLHDGIIQSIYAVGLTLGECRRLVASDPAEAQARLEQSISNLNTVIRDVRNFIVGLEPEALKGRGFGAALESIVTALGPAPSTRIAFDVDPKAADRLDATQSTHLLQIAREAISNAIRHGAASRMNIALRLGPGGVHLELQDDGKGFNSQTPNGSGFGLRNIESRTRELNARGQVRSEPGQGTRITIEVPSTSLQTG
jgi:PAS domain S-box-containing protein